MIKICTFSLRWLSGWQLLMSACSHVHTHTLSLSHTNTYTQTHTAKPSLTQSTIRLWMTVLGPPAVSCGGITVCSLSFSWNVHPALTFKQITSFLLKTTLIHLLSISKTMKRLNIHQKRQLCHESCLLPCTKKLHWATYWTVTSWLQVWP